MAEDIETRSDIGGESDNGTETSEDTAILFQPETPPAVPYAQKQRGSAKQQYEHARAKIEVQSQKINIYKGKVERSDITIAELKKRQLSEGGKEKMKGLEAKVASQYQQISTLTSENKDIHRQIINLKT